MLWIVSKIPSHYDCVKVTSIVCCRTCWSCPTPSEEAARRYARGISPHFFARRQSNHIPNREINVRRQQRSQRWGDDAKAEKVSSEVEKEVENVNMTRHPKDNQCAPEGRSGDEPTTDRLALGIPPNYRVCATATAPSFRLNPTFPPSSMKVS